MALTQLADLIRQEGFIDYVINQTPEQASLFRSGVVVKDPAIDALAKANKTGEFNIPFLNDLSGDSNVSSDVLGTTSTPQKLTFGDERAVKHNRNQSWQMASLAKHYVGADPMASVAQALNSYWDKEFQKILVSSLRGVFADNIANDSEDMVVDLYTDTAGTVPTAEKLSAAAIIDADAQMGEAESFPIIVMHPLVLAGLLKQNLVTTIPASEQRGELQYYMGKLVIKSSSLPVVAGTNHSIYHTYLLGAGSVAFGEGVDDYPFEVERLGSAGNGGGVTTVYSRRSFVLHPAGFKYTATNSGSGSPSNATLATATNWNREKARNQCRFALIRSHV
jgi:hypothetical protein